MKQIITILSALAILFTTTPKAQAASGSLYVGDDGYNLSENSSGTGWAWNAETETLTLGAGYSGGSIQFYAPEDTVYLALSANATVVGFIKSTGSLAIDAGSYTLNIPADNESNGLEAHKNLSITGGTINIAGYPSIFAFNDLSITGNTSLNLDNGISASGSLLIHTSGAVNSTGYGINANKDLTISSGTVVSSAEWNSLFGGVNLTITGDADLTAEGYIQGNGEINISTSGSVSVESTTRGIYASRKLNISSGMVDVVSGDSHALRASETVSVSGGTITLTRTDGGALIYGTLVHTGGTINGQGPPSVPTVVTGTATEITDSSALLSGSVTDNGGSDILLLTIRWRYGAEGAIHGEQAIGSDELFTLQLSTLNAATTYYFSAAAQNSEGWGYGEWVEFTTDDAPPSNTIPTVVTGTVNAEITSAVVSGSVTDNGGATVTAYKIEYRKSGESTVTEVTASGNDENFTGEITGLESETMYSTRVAAQNSEGWGYGDWKSFVTESAPEVISVTVQPETISVAVGGTQAFTAEVITVGGASDEVTWSVEGGVTETAINTSGELYVASGEISETLTVIATSVFDPTKEGTATVTVTGLPSNDATLSVLTVSAGTLTPAFDPQTMVYAVNVPNETTGITLTAEANHSGASVIGTGEKTLEVGSNPFDIVVTAENGTTTKTYTVTIVRQSEDPSDDATLASLTVSTGMLTPAFDAETLNYTVEVENSISSITVFAESNHSGASITGTGPKELSEGTNPFEVIVIAEDGITTKTYTLVVDRYVGINENGGMQWVFYPNPTNGIVNIQTNGYSIPTVKVYNLQGMLLFEVRSHSVDLSGLVNGMYILNVDGETMRVIKN